MKKDKKLTTIVDKASETKEVKVKKTTKKVKTTVEEKVEKVAKILPVDEKIKAKPQLVDRTKLYGLKDAIELLKKIAKTKFVSSLELHINTLEKGLKQNVALPFGTGKKIRVTVVDDSVIAKIDKGIIDFDVLIAHPSFMPKLAKYAKVLGPKGLMPNPKNGTVTPNTEKAVESFSKGQIQIKTESEFPIIHQLVGKINMKTEELEANVRAIIEAIKKNKIKSAFLAGTMTPSVKLDVEKI